MGWPAAIAAAEIRAPALGMALVLVEAGDVGVVWVGDKANFLLEVIYGTEIR